MRETGTATSLLLLAMGAVLAFAVDLSTTGIDLNAVGVILMVVGLLGLLMSFVLLGAYAPWGRTTTTTGHTTYISDVDRDVTPPHEHRRVDSTDVVYEDDQGPHVERVHRVR